MQTPQAIEIYGNTVTSLGRDTFSVPLLHMPSLWALL